MNQFHPTNARPARLRFPPIPVDFSALRTDPEVRKRFLSGAWPTIVDLWESLEDGDDAKTKVCREKLARSYAISCAMNPGSRFKSSPD